MRLVLSSVPPDRAADIARALVDERLAACVSSTPVRSVYRWQGALQEADEVKLLIKTEAARVPALTARLRALHPYEVPEILVLPVEVEASNARYIEWVHESTRAE